MPYYNGHKLFEFLYFTELTNITFRCYTNWIIYYYRLPSFSSINIEYGHETTNGKSLLRNDQLLVSRTVSGRDDELGRFSHKHDIIYLFFRKYLNIVLWSGIDPGVWQNFYSERINFRCRHSFNSWITLKRKIGNSVENRIHLKGKPNTNNERVTIILTDMKQLHLTALRITYQRLN